MVSSRCVHAPFSSPSLPILLVEDGRSCGQESSCGSACSTSVSMCASIHPRKVPLSLVLATLRLCSCISLPPAFNSGGVSTYFHVPAFSRTTSSILTCFRTMLLDLRLRNLNTATKGADRLLCGLHPVGLQFGRRKSHTSHAPNRRSPRLRHVLHLRMLLFHDWSGSFLPYSRD